MRLQSINSVTMVQKCQSNSRNNKQKAPMPTQQSFGRIIFDERGIENITDDAARELISKTLKLLKTMTEDIANQESHDILVHPFQYKHTKSCGIRLVYPDSLGSGSTYYHIPADGYSTEFSADKMEHQIRYVLPFTTTFAGQSKSIGKGSFFWDVTKPLAEDILHHRFNA